ncbi:MULTISPECIES: type VI secretion protein [unclassified Pseudomonas]|uniref:type VI secretion protein n=1 Tax=unclassified Pseudomonas TaxID=196821 RepID=UPI000C883417|nr:MULTISPECIES: type VI secretion protein [unclassified Pseudomonas]PMZ85857.1 type VI secretion protein [Pseudomonas sp. FW215-T2]PNA08344.1 type VI secretion protein [Pseudomonas sp. FW215-R3]PNB34540.1 type VI secretion protein [Pseudomonas sp. FW305-131]
MIARFFAFALFLTLAGCSFFGPRVDLDNLTLDVAPKANDDTPIAVDFIAVNDPDLLKQLSGITARQWFAERDQYQRDYRQLMTVWGLELVPGQFIDKQPFPLGGKRATGLLVFASYNTPGAHRLRLDDQSDAWLKFDSREMTLVSNTPQ